MVKEKSKKKSKLQIAQEKAQAGINETNHVIGELGTYTENLYKSLTKIQEKFDRFRNIPNEKN